MSRLFGTSVLILIVAVISAQPLAFPGAEGFGKYTTGGRGGEVIVVTNLNDDGPGSFRDALQKKYPRIITFGVAGVIELESVLFVNNGDLTIAGQTAPGDGITLKNYSIKIKGDNVILRYIRSRMGDERQFQDDAISITGQKNIIVDHCSFSWAIDECASFYDNENSTIQYCIISESLNNSYHRKGEHGYAGIWGGKKATFHHNLFAHHKSRNPRFHGARYHHQPELEIVDFSYNVIYNWMSNNSYGGEEGNHNLVGNYYKPGPATGSHRDKLLDPYEPYGKFYLEGNVLVGSEGVSHDNWEGVDGDTEVIRKIRLLQPIEVMPLAEETAGEAYLKVLAEVGMTQPRDEIDERIVREVEHGTATYGSGIIDSQGDVGGFPVYRVGEAPADNDSDGMPDIWEEANGLDPNNDQDQKGFLLDSTYTNVEMYFNGLVK